MIDTYFVRKNVAGVVVCASCPEELNVSATHVAIFDKTNGSGQGAWAVCPYHVPAAAVAFGPCIPVAEFEP